MAYVKLSYEEPYSSPPSRVPLLSAPPINLAINDVRQLHDDQAMMKDSLAKLREELDDSSASADVLEILERMRIASARTNEHSQALWELVPLTQRATTRTAIVAEKVFGTPELLEEIFTYLDLDEVITAMRVKKAWNSTVQGSVKLKRWLGVSSPVDDFFHCAFLMPGCHRTPHTPWCTPPGRSYISLPSFMEFRKTGRWSHADCWHPNFVPKTQLGAYKEHVNILEIEITCKPSVGREPGTRVASTPICYPSVHQLRYTIFCQCGSRCGNAGEFILSPTNGKGITVGDVARHTNEILRTTGHITRSCIHAQVYYDARVELLDNDPITVLRSNAIEEYEQGPDFDSDDMLRFFRCDSDPMTASPSSLSSGEDSVMVDVDEEGVLDDENHLLEASESEWKDAEFHFRVKRFPYDDVDYDDLW